MSDFVKFSEVDYIFLYFLLIKPVGWNHKDYKLFFQKLSMCILGRWPPSQTLHKSPLEFCEGHRPSLHIDNPGGK